MAVDTQLLHALTRALAALVDAETKGSKQIVAAARIGDPNAGPLLQEQTPRAATVEYCGVCVRAFIEAALGPDAEKMRAVGLHRAIESSGALPRLARSMMPLSNVAVELDEALMAAAAAKAGGRAGGSRGTGGSSGSSSSSTAVRVHREGAIKQIRRVCAIVMELWDGHAEAIQAAARSEPSGGGKAGEAAASRIRWFEGLLSDPCVRHFMLQHLLAQVAAADGGSCYGMAPRQLLQAAEPMVPESDAMRLEVPNEDPFHTIMAAMGGGAEVPLLLLDCVYTSVAGWTVHSRPPPAAAAATAAGSGGGGGDGGSDCRSGSGITPDLQWPPGVPWQARNVFALVDSGGRSGLLRRPDVPLRGMQGLMRRLVDVCLASLVPGIKKHQQEQQRKLGGKAGASAGTTAQLYTIANAQPTATGRAFPARGSLMCASRATLLAFSNRCLQAQERLQQQQQKGGVAVGWGQALEPPQGDIRALWRPLVRITHACLDVALVTGVDLGECGFDKSGEAAATADANTKPPLYNEAVDALRFIERLMSPCGGLRLPRLPPAHAGESVIRTSVSRTGRVGLFDLRLGLDSVLGAYAECCGPDADVARC